MTIDEYTLEKFRVEIVGRLSPHLLDTHADVAIDWFTGDVEARIYGYVWSEKLRATQIKYPRDWWQAFKQRWFPAWALRRWPVEAERHNLDMRVLYPDFRPSLPEQRYNFAIVCNSGRA